MNPEEAKIVQTIYETYSKLRSFRMTAKAVNEMGYRTKAYHSRRGNHHGNKKFNKNAIAHILQSTAYLGKVSHNGDIFEGRHEAIIDEKLWQNVNEHIAANKVVRRKPRPQKMHTFLLESIVRCGWCGGQLTPSYSGGRSRHYYYYICTGLNRGADECKMKRVSAPALEDAIAGRLIEMGKDQDLLNEILDEANCNSRKEVKILQERKDLQRRALAPIEQEIKNIVKFISQGKNMASLGAELERLEIRKKEIEGEIEKIDLEFRELKNRTIDAEIISEGLEFFEQAWEVADPKQKKDLMRLYVHKIIWTPEKIKMGLYTRPVSEISIKSSNVNHDGQIAVDRINWLPGSNSLHNVLFWRKFQKM